MEEYNAGKLARMIGRASVSVNNLMNRGLPSSSLPTGERSRSTDVGTPPRCWIEGSRNETFWDDDYRDCDGCDGHDGRDDDACGGDDDDDDDDDGYACDDS